MSAPAPFHRLRRAFVRAFMGWHRDHASSMAAAIAYYTVFSMAPLLLIIAAFAGLFLGHDKTRAALAMEGQQLIGEAGAQVALAILDAAHNVAGSVVSVVIGIGALLLGATSVFGELQSDLDRIWNAPPAVTGLRTGIRQALRTRLLAFAIIIGFGLLMLGWVLLSAVIGVLDSQDSTPSTGRHPVLFLTDLILSTALIALMFSVIYKLLPRVPVRWSDAWAGSAMASVFFSAGKILIGLYLAHAAFTSVFGAAGTFAALLVWVYYSAQIFLFGAEFARHLPEVEDDPGVKGKLVTGV